MILRRLTPMLRKSAVPVCLFLTAGFMVLATGGSAADWLDWRGPVHSGVSFETELPSSTSEVLWRMPYGGRSTPVIQDGRIFVINSAGKGVMQQERVLALDLQTGKMIWEHRFNVFHTDIPRARVGWSSPVIDPETGNVYAHGIQGMFFCFNRDGEILWSRSLTETLGRISGYGGRTHTPIVDEHQVIISFLNSSFGAQGRGGHRFLSMNKHTGDIQWWSAPAGPPKDTTYAVPVVTVIDGQRLLIAAASDGAVYAMRARTGEKVWGFQLSQRGLNSSVVIDGYKIYAMHSEENHDSTDMGRVVCIDGRGHGDVTKTHEIWRQTGVAAGYASPLLHEGRLYVLNNFGVLHCYDAETGREIWRHAIERVAKGSPVWADGKIYVPTVNGTFSILEDTGDEARLLDRLTFESTQGVVELFGSPAVSDGRIVFFTTEEIVCLGAKAAGRQAVELPPMPQETAAASTPSPALVQIRPGEILTKPGKATRFKVVSFDEQGRELGNVNDVTWSYNGSGAIIESDGTFRPTANAGSIGTVTAASGDLKAAARVRIVPDPPIAEDFESFEEGQMLPWWIGVSPAKHAIENVDGSKVLKKLADNRGPAFNRSRVYITPPLETGYTVQADLMGTQKGRRRGDVGLINARYRLELFGGLQRLRVMSWVPGPRFEKRMDFSWDPDRWYRVKFHVNLADGKAHLRVKVWPREESEPENWTLEAEDPQPNLQGSAGIYAYSMTPLYYDNVRIYR